MNYIAVLYLEFEHVTLIFFSKELLYSLSLSKRHKKETERRFKSKMKEKKLKTKNKSTILFLNGSPN